MPGKTKNNELDILSAIWILACNDENPIITFKGLQYRLGLPTETDIKTIIEKHSELFRKGVSHKVLENWKLDMLNNKRLPSWIKDMDDPNEREKHIRQLTTKDLFRSQFRTAVGAPKSELAVIDWGLQHIDRLRKTIDEQRQNRLRFLSGVLVPVLSTLVAVIAVLSTFYMQKDQYELQKSQHELRKYEITLKPKQEAYAGFMQNLQTAFNAALQKNLGALNQYYGQIESAYFSMEIFLDSVSRKDIFNKLMEYKGLCYTIVHPKDTSNLNTIVMKQVNLTNDFRNNLYPTLFQKKE